MKSGWYLQGLRLQPPLASSHVSTALLIPKYLIIITGLSVRSLQRRREAGRRDLVAVGVEKKNPEYCGAFQLVFSSSSVFNILA